MDTEEKKVWFFFFLPLSFLPHNEIEISSCELNWNVRSPTELWVIFANINVHVPPELLRVLLLLLLLLLLAAASAGPTYYRRPFYRSHPQAYYRRPYRWSLAAGRSNYQHCCCCQLALFKARLHKTGIFSKAFGIENFQFYIPFDVKVLSTLFTVWHLNFLETVNKA